MTLLEILSYIVTVVGILLCVFFVIFIFAGKRLAGDKGGPQIIKYKGLELQTNSIITMLLVSVAVTVLPLILLSYLESKKPAATISPEAYEIFLVGRIEDESGRPLEGAKAAVTEIKPDGKMQRLKEETVETDGNFNFQVRVGAGDKLKLETHKEGYRKQTIILQLKGVNFPSVLVKKKGGE
jgi:hypothetical protein